MELGAYSTVINQLKSMVKDPDLDEALLRLTPNDSKSARFLIKMELKRLTTPCQRIIDLRGRVDGVCRPVEHDGRIHYLDDVAQRTFERCIKEYNGCYTLGVYEEVMTTENSFRAIQQRENQDKLRQLQAQERKSAEDEALLLANNQIPQYPGRLIRFGQYVGRSEERMHFSIRISVKSSNGEIQEGITSNLSLNGCRIRMPQEVEYPLGSKLNLRFIGLEQQNNFPFQEYFQYEVAARDLVRDGNVWYRLRRTFDSATFDAFISNFIQGNKRRYKVDIDHVVAAVQSKGYEQYFVPRMHALPIFINEKQGQLLPSSVLVGEVNRDLIHYWRDEEYRLQLEQVLTPERLAQLAANPCTPMVLYSFTHASKGRLYYYTATQQELTVPQPEPLFTAFGSQKYSWRVWLLQLEAIAADSGAINTLKIADNGNAKLDSLPLSPRVQGALSQISHLLLLSDVTSERARAVWANQPYDRSELNSLNRFVLPRGKGNNISLEALSFSDLRCEPRYSYKTTITGVLRDQTFAGFSRDISTTGLQLELSEPLNCSVGDNLLLDLPKLQEMSNKHRLLALPYEIVGCNSTETVLHLKASGALSRHEGHQFLKLLIEHNKHKLPQPPAPNQLQGMAQALRNLVVNQRCVTPFFIHKRGARYAFDSIASPSELTPIVELLNRLSDNRNEPNLYPLVKAESLHERLLEPLKRLQRQDPPLIFDIYLQLSNDPSGERISQISCCYADEFANEMQRRFFIEMARKKGEFHAWRLSLSRAAGRPDMKFVNDELTYISQYAIHRAKPLEAELWSVVGVGEIVDITAEVLGRQLVSRAAAPIAAQATTTSPPAQPTAAT